MAFPMVIYKPSDQTVLGTTLTNDTAFVFTLQGKHAYRLTANLFATVDAFGVGLGINMNLYGGTVAMTDVRLQYRGIGALGAVETGLQVESIKDEYAFIPISDSTVEIQIDGSLRCAEPGTLILQFAESSGTSIPGAKMKRDSVFELLDVTDFIPPS